MKQVTLYCNKTTLSIYFNEKKYQFIFRNIFNEKMEMTVLVEEIIQYSKNIYFKRCGSA